jgi:hypothetical protein
MTIRTYASPEGFKQALEQRLRSAAKTGAAMAREHQLPWPTLDDVTRAV